MIESGKRVIESGRGGHRKWYIRRYGGQICKDGKGVIRSGRGVYESVRESKLREMVGGSS